MKQIRTVVSYFIALSMILAFTACQNEFDEKHPYTVEIKQFRSIYHAQSAKDRLDDMGVDTQILPVSKDGGNLWYYVVSNAYETTKEAQEEQDELTKKYNFKKLKLLNYASIKKDIASDEELNKENEVEFVTHKMPITSNDVLDVVKYTPHLNNYNIYRMSVFNLPKNEEEAKKFSAMYNIKTDLPRGINKKLLKEKALAFSESVINDNLYGDRVTLNVVKLKTDHGIEGDVASFFADKILNTGNYLSEEKTAIEIDSFVDLKGYKVVIEPKKNKKRTYFVLTNETSQWVAFVQSTKKTSEQLVEIVESFGTGNGMLDYAEFHNTFKALPTSLDPNDTFIAFSIDKLGWSYSKNKGHTKWSKYLVGHWSASALYHTKKKGSWHYGLFDLLTKRSNDYLVSLYGNEVRHNSNISTVNIHETKGKIVYAQRYSKSSRKYIKYPMEINFNVGRYFCMIDNTQYSWLNKKTLLNRANKLQLSK